MFDNGSEILRADFHLHTKKDKEFVYNGSENDYIKEYIDALKSQSIQIGIITNHNKFDYEEYKALSKVAGREDIFLLPGVELSIKEGADSIHVLFVFNKDEWLKEGNNEISKVISSLFIGVANPENENTHCNKDLFTCINEFSKVNKDFFMIFAHVEQNKGLWNECGGAIISSLSANPQFKKYTLGFQKARTRDLIKKVHDWMGYDLALLEGSDPKQINEIGKGEKVYIKIGCFTYNALKFAVKDYQERVFSEIPVTTHGYIKSLTCTGGKLDKQVFSPSSELNTLIGIRGSGKSSIIEVLRYALEMNSSTNDNEYKDNLVKNVLGSGGEVNVEIVDKYQKHYFLKRILNEKCSIYDDKGNILNFPVSGLLNNPIYFGQKDLALSKTGYEHELLNKMIGKNALDISTELNEITISITNTIKKYKSISDIPSKLEDLRSKNSELEHKLKIFKEKGVDEKLKKQVSCNKDLEMLRAIYNKEKLIAEALDNSFSNDSIDSLKIIDCQSEFNQEIMMKASKQIKESIEIIGTIDLQRKALRESMSKLDAIITELVEKINSLKEEFAEIKRDINDNTIDVESFIKYQKQLTSNNIEIEKMEESLKQKNSLQLNLKALFSNRNELLKKRFCAYEKGIDLINSSQEQLKISIGFKEDKTTFKNELKNNFKGTGLNEQKYNDLSNSFTDFASISEDYYVNDGKKLAVICARNYLKVAEKIDEIYPSLVGIEIRDSISINYHGKLLSKHSLGQRASALVLFILTQNDSDVIIIDQPEDDLDNQVIYNELIKTIKEEKRNMQFIFATHNANIPVLGDAERIVLTTYESDSESITLSQGNIDTPDSQKQIINIMEGGEEAFKLRNSIYTSWK